MQKDTGSEIQHIQKYFELAAQVAAKATCHRGHCGSVIVKDGMVIGEGYNSPPCEDETARTCDATWDYTKKPKYDLTCCVHAEWRAVLDACKHYADKIDGSTLYFMRIDEKGKFTDAGEPYCTTCSRLAMDAGVSNFALWNNGQAEIFTLYEYNQRSYDFYK